jgi:hypothetical protein
MIICIMDYVILAAFLLYFILAPLMPTLVLAVGVYLWMLMFRDLLRA